MKEEYNFLNVNVTVRNSSFIKQYESNCDTDFIFLLFSKLLLIICEIERIAPSPDRMKRPSIVKQQLVKLLKFSIFTFNHNNIDLW